MKEIRDIKLDLLMGNQNPIVDLFNQITNDLKIINCEVYHKEGIEFIYFSGDKWIFYQDCNNEEFWCNYDIYWSLFESNFDLEYQEIQSITKYLVEEALKREVNTTSISSTNTIIGVEEALKREVNTTETINTLSLIKVEEALKREVNTTIRCKTNNCIPVEEVLKRDLGTPEADPLAGFFHVEDALLSAREWLEPLKKELGTPLTTLNNVFALEVEEALKKEIAAPDKRCRYILCEVETVLYDIQGKEYGRKTEFEMHDKTSDILTLIKGKKVRYKYANKQPQTSTRSFTITHKIDQQGNEREVLTPGGIHYGTEPGKLNKNSITFLGTIQAVEVKRLDTVEIN